MKKLHKIIATGVTALAITAIGVAPALADSPGQIVGGPNAYVVKDITTSGSYAASVSPACGDVIQYSAELHNPMNGGLTNIVVSANLGNGSFSAVPAEGASQGMTASVSVNLPSGGSLAYQGGTTTLYDGSGNVVRTLSDDITSGGVNIGNLPGSTTEFVNFRAKVNCAAAPVTFTSTATVTVSATARASAICPPGQGGDSATVSANGSATASANATSNVSQADADQKAHDAASQAATPAAQANAQANANALAVASVKCSSAVVTAVSTPQVNRTLPNTGAGDVLGLFGGASALGGAAHYFFVSRRRK